MDFVTIDNIVRNASAELRDKFRNASLEFDRLYWFADDRMLDFSRKAGWKGVRPLSFVGFNGIHVECSSDRFELFDADNVIGSVELDGVNGLRKEGVFTGLNEFQIRNLTFSRLMSDANLQMAREFTAGGRMYVTGFAVREADGKRVCIADMPQVPGFSVALVRDLPQLFGENSTLELMSGGDYRDALKEQVAYPVKDGSVSFDSVGVSPRPCDAEFVELSFNGESFDSLGGFAREFGSYDEYKAYLDNSDALGVFCHDVDVALNRAAGLTDAKAQEQLYHFRSGRYLMMGGYMSGAFMVTGFGRHRPYWIEATESGYEVQFPDGKREAFDAKGLASFVNGKLFSDENLMRVRDDFRSAGMALNTDRRVEERLKLEFNQSKALFRSI